MFCNTWRFPVAMCSFSKGMYHRYPKYTYKMCMTMVGQGSVDSECPASDFIYITGDTEYIYIMSVSQIYRI